MDTDLVSNNIGLMGGTFNPVQIGHIRHAIEVAEALNIDKILLTPAAVPPHKSGYGLLPFDLRLKMLQAATAPCPRLGVNDLEAHLEGPSYTCTTLSTWNRLHPALADPFFLLGAEDFAMLDTWRDWQNLPELARFVVVSRAGTDENFFSQAIAKLWTNCRARKETRSGLEMKIATLPSGREIIYFSVIRLDISASLIRRRWITGCDVHGLMPEAALDILEANREMVRRTWMEQLPQSQMPDEAH